LIGQLFNIDTVKLYVGSSSWLIYDA